MEFWFKREAGAQQKLVLPPQKSVLTCVLKPRCEAKSSSWTTFVFCGNKQELSWWMRRSGFFFFHSNKKCINQTKQNLSLQLTFPSKHFPLMKKTLKLPKAASSVERLSALTHLGQDSNTSASVDPGLFLISGWAQGTAMALFPHLLSFSAATFNFQYQDPFFSSRDVSKHLLKRSLVCISTYIKPRQDWQH